MRRAALERRQIDQRGVEGRAGRDDGVELTAARDHDGLRAACFEREFDERTHRGVILDDEHARARDARLARRGEATRLRQRLTDRPRELERRARVTRPRRARAHRRGCARARPSGAARDPAPPSRVELWVLKRLATRAGSIPGPSSRTPRRCKNGPSSSTSTVNRFAARRGERDRVQQARFVRICSTAPTFTHEAVTVRSLLERDADAVRLCLRADRQNRSLRNGARRTTAAAARRRLGTDRRA